MQTLLIPGFVVRPARLEDAAAWASYACLPEVKQHTSSTASNVDDVKAEIQRCLAGEPNTPIRFVMLPLGEKTIVATVGFHSISSAFGTAEITYDVTPSQWGKGIAQAACRAATRWGFETRGWHRIQATTVLSNLRSQQVLQRCGFQREGLARKLRLVRGVPTDYWVYSAIPEDLPPLASIISKLS
ncbi:GNAT family N-acetyltransferase [Roseateles oligotrophus]|uniref:GNAT family N-acetyltransferase n=1 Tax=Roseateles oligotrophus TaxID=1769250 RepID=A0ABT2YEG8_9BURK|nr:GNAT family protein [Roseateles oligotrophus]MCV2368419.1 GNAT family N-acetyltransferase [Roseateles oligotrophus]